jgi:hypothetical protein
VQRGRHVAEVVHAHVRRGGQTQPAYWRSAAGRWPRRRHGPLRLRVRHGREILGRAPSGLAMLAEPIGESAFLFFLLLIVCACETTQTSHTVSFLSTS